MSPPDRVPAAERLNLFQRLMLRWRELHPYNPVHVLHVAAPLDLPRLRTTLAARLQALGLGGLSLAPGGRRLQRGPGPELPLDLVAPGPDPRRAVERRIEDEFNRPFAADGPTLMRAFVVQTEGGFHLGLAYDHFIAGGDAIARLLVDTALDYLGAAPATPAPVPAPAYRQLLARHPGWALRALAGLPASTAATRRAHRPPVPVGGDGANGFVGLRLDGARLHALHDALRRWGVTLNDVLLAAVMLAVAPLAAARLQQPRRREIAVASIMNIRRDFGPGARQSTAPCLAALRVGHAVPAGIGLEALARELHEQTARIKREHRYLQSVFGLGLSALLWPMLTPVRRARFYLKHHPVWGGVTTLDLNRSWQQADPALTARLGYLRAVPTGPLSQLVLAATTAHDELHLGLAYRRAAFTPAAAADLLDAVSRLLAGPDGVAPAEAAASTPALACAAEAGQ